ncbi:hypothetical protein BU24DRAFT_466128 [Aaosphaeria arxii CBS 175.79]|uniref:Uncharacterized protein n=1 Tax=Aaosphaeria arxii CBS 175.79 TaxID=1450172 RepID=A0A6A5XEY8_9PLEO|nr:uncharacterized protein BU24DRAFT_466128 [Aaosphaeria arxii CBS 175.79]KAF2011416.1 hypothetical protein BU24DRAFT_466128 [Aaosphaeria arxii CBS 175.79]
MENEGSSSQQNWGSLRRLSTSREPSMSADSSRPQHSGLHLPPLPGLHNMPPERIRRYPGDGFDFRRPAPLQHTASPQPDFIDLTSDEPGPSARNGHQEVPVQRPPRFSREIIHIDEEDARPPAPTFGSPEIEFLSSRRISPVLRQPSPDDDVEITGSAPVPAERRVMQARQHLDVMVGVFQGLLQNEQFSQRSFAHLRAHLRNAGRQQPVHPPRRRVGARIHVGFVPPMMNFDEVGFDLGLGGNAPTPTPPTYDAPPPAPEGFTRTVAEEDTLVCPNCEDELCMGESDLKKQVWINKACGHVYCGECTANRHSSKRSAKGKEKASTSQLKTFKECVVEGCGKKLAHRSAMIQIFL